MWSKENMETSRLVEQAVRNEDLCNSLLKKVQFHPNHPKYSTLFFQANYIELYDICEDLLYKILQNVQLKKLLLATHRRPLIGDLHENTIGRLLMAIRNELLLEDPEHTEIDTSDSEDS